MIADHHVGLALVYVLLALQVVLDAQDVVDRLYDVSGEAGGLPRVIVVPNAWEKYTELNKGEIRKADLSVAQTMNCHRVFEGSVIQVLGHDLNTVGIRLLHN